MADMCTLYRDEEGVYHLESSNFHKDTEWFTDRPMQLEKTEATSDWFNNFNEMFNGGKGCMPNASLTIVDDDMSKDVVVSVFAEGYVKEGEGEDEGRGSRSRSLRTQRRRARCSAAVERRMDSCR